MQTVPLGSVGSVQRSASQMRRQRPPPPKKKWRPIDDDVLQECQSWCASHPDGPLAVVDAKERRVPGYIAFSIAHPSSEKRTKSFSVSYPGKYPEGDLRLSALSTQTEELLEVFESGTSDPLLTLSSRRI